MSADQTYDYHWIDEGRVAALEDAKAIPKQRTTKRQIDMTSLGVDEIKKIDDLMIAFGKQYADFLQRFAQKAWWEYSPGNNYRKLRDAFVQKQAQANATAKAEGRKPTSIFPYGLQARQWKMALQAASNTADRYWCGVLKKTKTTLWKRNVWQKLTPAEQHYINWLLFTTNDRFFSLMKGQTPKPSEKILAQGPIPRARSLCRLVRRVAHKVAGRFPVHGESRSVWFDTDCWSLGDKGSSSQELCLMTLRKNDRIRVRIKGKGPIRGTLVLVSTAEGFFVHVLTPIKPKRALKKATAAEKKAGAKTLVCQAIDQGFTEVATADDGRQFGLLLGKLITEYAAKQDEWLKKRNHLEAIARNTTDIKKRQRIRKFNLGKKKWMEYRRVCRARIEACVNGAINQLLKDGKTDVLIIEELGQCFRMSGISKKMRNRLSRWVRGLIAERLAFKAAVYGCRIVKVPAAYSSQCCPECKFVDRGNRKNNKFLCLSCGYEGHADVVGARNLLERAHNKLFTRFTAKEKVRKILNEEHQAWCAKQGRKPGLVSKEEQQTMA